MIQLDGLCIVCNIPSKIVKDQNYRLHNENGTAVEWRDGYKVHALHGICLEETLYNKIVNKQFNLQEILSLENIEHRMLALKYDPEKITITPQASLINSNKGTDLFLVKEIFTQDAYFIKYKDPSTDRVYISGVDPKVAEETKDAEKCRLWKFPLLWDAYNTINDSDKFYKNVVES